MASIDKIWITREQYPAFVEYIKDLDKRHDSRIVESLRSPDGYCFENTDEFPVSVFPTFVDIWILEDRENCPNWIYEYVCDQYGKGGEDGSLKDFSEKDYADLDLQIHLMRLKEVVTSSPLWNYFVEWPGCTSLKDPLRGVSMTLGRKIYKGAVIEITLIEVGKYEVKYSYENECLYYSYESLTEVLQYLNDIFSVLLNPLMKYRKKIPAEINF